MWGPLGPASLPPWSWERRWGPQPRSESAAGLVSTGWSWPGLLGMDRGPWSGIQALGVAVVGTQALGGQQLLGSEALRLFSG